MRIKKYYLLAKEKFYPTKQEIPLLQFSNLKNDVPKLSSQNVIESEAIIDAPRLRGQPLSAKEKEIKYYEQ